MNNFEIGALFEQYVLDFIFTPTNYDIVELSHNHNGKYFVESNLNPDIKYRCKKSKIEFWVECKFRSKTRKKYNLNKKQIERYKTLKEPIFYILGLGENPKKPEQIGLIKFNNIYQLITRENILRNLIKKSEIKNFNELLELTKKP